MRLLIAIAAAATGCAQNSPEPTIRVDVNLVNVAFIVRDSVGALSGDLRKDDIEVYEDRADRTRHC
jgi:hypothetical protein